MSLLDLLKKDELKKIEELEEEVKSLKQVNEELSSKIEEEESDSSVTFLLDTDLKVTVQSKINSDIIPSLIDKDYITADESEDEHVLQLAFVLLANEISDQIINGVNDYAKDKLDS